MENTIKNTLNIVINGPLQTAPVADLTREKIEILTAEMQESICSSWEEAKKQAWIDASSDKDLRVLVREINREYSDEYYLAYFLASEEVYNELAALAQNESSDVNDDHASFNQYWGILHLRSRRAEGRNSRADRTARDYELRDWISEAIALEESISEWFFAIEARRTPDGRLPLNVYRKARKGVRRVHALFYEEHAITRCQWVMLINFAHNVCGIKKFYPLSKTPKDLRGWLEDVSNRILEYEDATGNFALDNPVQDTSSVNPEEALRVKQRVLLGSEW